MIYKTKVLCPLNFHQHVAKYICMISFMQNKAILKTIRHFPTCFYRNSIKKLNFLNKVTYLFWNNFMILKGCWEMNFEISLKILKGCWKMNFKNFKYQQIEIKWIYINFIDLHIHFLSFINWWNDFFNQIYFILISRIMIENMLYNLFNIIN